MKEFGCEKIYVDKESGTSDTRKNFLKLKNDLKEGDTVVVTELSRTGRKLLSVLEFIEFLKNNNINFISLRENINMKSPSGILILQIFASIAEFERSRLIERQRVGIDYAKKKGVKFGRPHVDENKLEQAIKLYNSKTISIKEISNLTGISKATLYRYLKFR